MLSRTITYPLVFLGCLGVLEGACGNEFVTETAASASSSDSAAATSSASSTSDSTGGSSATAGTGGAPLTGGAGGGGGGATCSSFGDSCTPCVYQQCQNLYCSCFANSSCAALVLCFNTCPSSSDPVTCQQNCMHANQDAISEAFLVGDCAATNCSAGCPGTTQLTPCEICMFQQCDTAMNNCLGSSECAAFLLCYTACTDVSCRDGCTAMYPAGATDAMPVGDCRTANCASDCQ